jgi:hypothetical protein
LEDDLMRRLAVLNFVVLGTLAALYFVPPKGIQLRAKYEQIRDTRRLLRPLRLGEFDDSTPARFV